MPEGDTVFRTAAQLNRVLAGATLTEFDLRVPGAATVDLRGETTQEVVPRGKHLLHRIGDATLHSHLRMEGTWHIYQRGARWRRPAFQARAVIGTDTVQAVGFDLSGVEVIPSTAETDLVGHLGPDPLSMTWDAAEAARRLSTDPRPAHVALLDQRNIAGFGNVYATEILFLQGISPHRPALEVDAPALVGLGARLIRANRDRSRRVFTGDDRPGRNTWVYGRERRSCRRCGGPLRSEKLGADPTRLRDVVWCPHCQR